MFSSRYVKPGMELIFQKITFNISHEGKSVFEKTLNRNNLREYNHYFDYASEDPQIPKTLRTRNCPLSFSNS